MTYEVILEEHSTYQLLFDSEQEFKETREEQGCCVSDLLQNIVFQKSNHEINPTDAMPTPSNRTLSE